LTKIYPWFVRPTSAPRTLWGWAKSVLLSPVRVNTKDSW
jgi:hypothetical protein